MRAACETVCKGRPPPLKLLFEMRRETKEPLDSSVTGLSVDTAAIVRQRANTALGGGLEGRGIRPSRMRDEMRSTNENFGLTAVLS